jgi:hypothetical protein
MRITILTALLFSLTFSLACYRTAQVQQPPPQTAGPVATNRSDALTTEEAQDLCNRVSQIKVLPMKNDRGLDSTFDAFMSGGTRVIPCLIEKVTDETRMADPRQAPTYADTRVGDVAYFLITDITQLDFVPLLPPEVQAKFPDQGVYAYFEFVEKPANRKKLRNNLRSWYVRKYL